MCLKKTGNLRTVLLYAIIAICSFFIDGELLAQDEDDNNNPNYFGEAFVSNPTPYVGEQIIFTFRYYVFAFDENISIDLDLPTFEGFWITGFARSDTRVETRNNTQYSVQEDFVEITPLQSGRITIPPPQFSIDTTEFFLRGESANSVDIEVLSLPEPVPNTFNGAVGQFSIGSEIDAREVTLGQPIRFTVDIQGAGNFELLRAPDLTLPEDVWQVISSTPGPPQYSQGIAGVQFGQRVFEWLVIPRQTGSLEIPPITFTHFDPQQGVFVDSMTPAFPVNVFPGSSNQDRLVDIADSLASRAPLALKPVDLTTQSRNTSEFLLAIWLLSPIIAVICGVWVLQRHYKQHQRQQKRFTQALRLVIRRLERLKVETNTSIVSEQALKIIEAYFADKMNQKRQSIELRSELLQQHNITDGVIAELFTTISAIEAVRYAPAHMRTSLQKELSEIIDILGKIDTVWSPASTLS